MRKLDENEMTYLAAVNDMWESTDIFADNVISDIEDTGGTFEDGNEVYVVPKLGDFGSPYLDDYFERVADDYKDFLRDRNADTDMFIPGEETNTATVMAEEIMGDPWFSPANAYGVDVVTKFDTGSPNYRVFDPDRDVELVDALDGRTPPAYTPGFYTNEEKAIDRYAALDLLENTRDPKDVAVTLYDQQAIKDFDYEMLDTFPGEKGTQDINREVVTMAVPYDERFGGFGLMWEDRRGCHLVMFDSREDATTGREPRAHYIDTFENVCEHVSDIVGKG